MTRLHLETSPQTRPFLPSAFPLFLPCPRLLRLMMLLPPDHYEQPPGTTTIPSGPIPDVTNAWTQSFAMV